MSTTFRRYAPEQSLLLPPDVREWLPEGHLSHHISDLVDGLDLTAFYAGYEGDGRRNAPYEPRMLVKVLLYAYATGVFSSRGIARKLEEDVGVPGAGGGQLPATPDDLRVSAAAPGRFQAVVRRGGRSGSRAGPCAVREAVCRRDEGAREREQAQGDELRSDAGGGTASVRRDRRAVAGGGRDRRRGRAVGAGGAGRRVAGGVASAGRSSGGDPGGEGAFGGGAAGGGRRPRTAGGPGSKPEGGTTVQAGVWRA